MAYNTKIPLFRRWVLQNFPFIEQDFDALTDYQLICKVVEYLNKVIEAVNADGEQIELLTNTVNQLQEYIENLDLQDEVNNKIDQMVEDGTFEQIVGQYITNKLDYYEITNQSESDVTDILSVNRAKVIVFKNDFTFNSTKSLTGNTILDLQGHTITFNIPSVVDDYVHSHGFFNFVSTDAFTGYNGNSNITIQNGTIVAGNCSFCHASNINIKNIHFVNCKNNHILEMCAIKDLNVEGCTFEGIPYGSTGEYIQIEVAQYNAFPWFDASSATYDETTCENVTINNSNFIEPADRNYIHYASFGTHAGAAGDTYTTNNVRLFNCKFNKPSNVAIQLYNINGLTIDTCNFEGESQTESSIHIRLRSGVVNSNISNCYFNGMTRAIELAREHLDTKNITINSCIFENYNNASYKTYSIISVWNPIQIDITNNTFKNFIQCAIYSQKDANYDASVTHILNIFNNIFLPQHNKDGRIIELRCAYNYVENNLFDMENYTYANTSGDRIVLGSSAIDNLFYANNVVSPHNLVGIRDVYDKPYDSETGTGGFRKVYGSPRPTGVYNSNSVTIDPTTYLIPTNFNTLVMTLGDGTNTQSIVLEDFELFGYLTARTWKIPVVKSDSTIGSASITLNAENKLIYSGDINLRQVKLWNRI